MSNASKNSQPNTLTKTSGFLWREYIVAFLIAMIFAVLLILGKQIVDRMDALRSASQDNVQWNLAQLDVELLALEAASLHAVDGRPHSLAELRRRFNVYFSRVNTISHMTLFSENLVQQDSVESLAQIKTILNRTSVIIDGQDSSLVLQLPQISAAAGEMRPLARKIGLDGVRIYAALSDAKREEFSHVVNQTATVNGVLIIALGTVLLFLLRQIRISRRRTSDLEMISNRNASTVNSALDAIIAVNMDGTIVEFNPAAARIFGYSRNAAVGKKLDELIVPDRYREAHRKGMARYKATGKKHVIDSGRVEMSALRSDGTEFPVEFSLGTTQTSSGQLVIAFLRDISQRVEQDKALRTARDEALEAAKAKSQFLAIMSHEMRTPLNGVMAVLDLLDATPLNAKQKTYVKTATTSAEILKQHVDDVLDLTRIQAGKLEFFPRAFNLLELLEEVESINLAMAAARGNRITLIVDMPQPYFVADRKRIHQVLTNLIGNAIKFTENGQIEIAARFVDVKADLVTVEFSVADTGVGIADDQQNRIFEDFVTLDASYQRNAEGAGLGLSICKSIVEAMSGEIGVKSQSGYGSTFWFRLPLKAAFGADKSPLEIKSLHPDWTGQQKLKVLVVEDNETNRFVAGEMLQAAHCDVVLAGDGSEGARLAIDQNFDLIFMDLSMPKMNGWDATRKIRSTAQAKSQLSPIYALTAHALPEEQKALLDAGMQGCILKPLRARELKDVLARVRSSPDTLDVHITAKAGTSASPIDVPVVDELREVLGQQMFEKQLNGFLEELNRLPGELTTLFEEESWPDLARLAHKHAGSAAIFGATRLSEKLRIIESTAHSKHSDALAAMLPEFENVSSHYAEAYSKYSSRD